jgi:hypothetical protein
LEKNAWAGKEHLGRIILLVEAVKREKLPKNAYNGADIVSAPMKYILREYIHRHKFSCE